MKRIQSIILLVFFAGFGWSANHGDLTGTNVHTPLKWIWADSAARVAQSIKNVDTMKVGFQKSDSTLWLLADSPAVWTWIGGQYARLDSATIPVIRGLNTMRGNPDFDSAQINVISGLNTMSGNPTIDSVNVSVLAIIDTARVTKGLSVGGKVYGDTLMSNWTTNGTHVVTGTATVDSLKSTKGITATTGRFSSTVTGDTLRATKGLSVGGKIYGDTLSGVWRVTSQLYTDGVLNANNGIISLGRANLVKLQLSQDSTKEMTISNDSLVMAFSNSPAVYYTIDTQADAALDTVQNIFADPMTSGDVFILQTVTSTRDVFFKQGGNIKVGDSGFLLDDSDDLIMLMCVGLLWVSLSRMDND